MVFLQGYDYEEHPVDKLKSMLWGLEALKMLDNRVSGSLASIDKARASLVTSMEVCYLRIYSS